MKIAISGHTAGIGKAFAQQLSDRGHDIVGISRREGENIRRIEHTANLIEPCDLFINNAQSQYAQTELLFAVWQRWQGEQKYIWNISTMMTQQPVNSRPDGQSDIAMSQYRNQKVALEDACRQLQHKSAYPRIVLIRPGGVATQIGFDNSNKANVDEWVGTILKIVNAGEGVEVLDISLGFSKHKIKI